MTEARDALFQAGQADVSWADAMVEMAQRSLDQVASVQRRERFRANWFVDPADPVPARWTDGLAVPDWLRDLLSCDGTVSPVFTDGAHPVSVGRTQRTVPDRTRRLVLQRDRKCRVPWCTQTRWLQVHHIIHDADDGPTDTWNLAGICPADHRLHHKGLLGIAGNADHPDGLVFTDAHGRVIDPATRPTNETDRATTGPAETLRTSHRRTTPTLVDPLPRPTPREPARHRGRARRVMAARLARAALAQGDVSGVSCPARG